MRPGRGDVKEVYNAVLDTGWTAQHVEGMDTGADARTARHPIGVVVERTGLSPELLRAWERRYGVVAPARDGTGQRLYSDGDVLRLRLLRRATLGGRSIGQVAPLETEALERLVREDEQARAPLAPPSSPPPSAPGDEHEVARALELARALDAAGLEALLRRAAGLRGLASFLELCAVFLRRVGEEWHAGRLSEAHEHLATALVQRVVAVAMDALPRQPGAPVLLVATLPGERHEVGLLLASAAAAAEGWSVLYLGIDLPVREIADAAARSGARAVGISSVFPADRARVAAEMRTLRASLPDGVPLLAGGGGARALSAELQPAGIRVFGDLPSLRQALRDLAEPPS